MIPLKIAVDVDMTVVNMLPLWFKWIEDQCGAKFDPMQHDHDEYWLTPKLERFAKQAFNNPEASAAFRANDFWRQPELYDAATPIFGSTQIIQDWIKFGHCVYFASTCNVGHYNSKRKFLQEFFPGIPLVDVDRKEFLDADVLVEDSADNLHAFVRRQGRGEVKGIYMCESYYNTFRAEVVARNIIQTPDDERMLDVAYNWNQVATKVDLYATRCSLRRAA